jgi:hypothetical protein
MLLWWFFVCEHFLYDDAIPLGLGLRFLISMGIKTVKMVSLNWIMISFYPWLKPWAMGNLDDTS